VNAFLLWKKEYARKKVMVSELQEDKHWPTLPTFTYSPRLILDTSELKLYGFYSNPFKDISRCAPIVWDLTSPEGKFDIP
jgi:hypothetical protein